MPYQPHPLLAVYSRNVQYHAFKRGWTKARLISELGTTVNTVNRIYTGTGRYIDPEVFAALMDLFDCDPNALLLPQADLDYSIALAA